MADVSQMFASPWLTAADLKGTAHTLVITAATIEKMKDIDSQEETDKVILSFSTPEGAQARKRLIINKSQYKSLALITGSSDTDNWVRKTVMLSPIPTSTPGKFTIAISGVAAPTSEGGSTF